MQRLCRECNVAIDEWDTFCTECDRRLRLRNTMGCLSVMAIPIVTLL